MTKEKFFSFPKLHVQRDAGKTPRLFIVWPAEISGTGKRRKEYFGPETDPESRARYLAARDAWNRAREEAAEIRARETEKRVAKRAPADARRIASVAKLVDLYVQHARRRYVKHGKPTGTADNIWITLRPFLLRFGTMMTADFGLDQLEEYQRELDESGRLCRNQVNARIRIICGAFAWGARHRTESGERIVPPAIAAELKMIENLRRGYCQAKDHPRKLAVPIKTIEKTIRHLEKPVDAMVRLQLITGARPNEIRRMKAREITRAEKDLWEYRPESYKTEHQERGGERKVIFLGPRAIKILKPILARQEKEGREEPGYLFRPADAAEIRHRRSQAADAKKTPSRRARDARRAADPRRRYADHYTSTAYREAVQRAAARAGVPDWTPYQIRKARATEIDRSLGQDAAAIALGHRNIKTTLDHYIDPRTEQARELARRIG